MLSRLLQVLFIWPTRLAGVLRQLFPDLLLSGR